MALTMVLGTDSGHYGPTGCGRAERESVCVFKVTSPDSERYGQWETERVCVCSKDHNRRFFAGSFRKVAKYSRILLFCLFCQQGGASTGGEGTGGEGPGGGELDGCIMHRVHTHLCLRHGAHTSLLVTEGWLLY